MKNKLNISTLFTLLLIGSFFVPTGSIQAASVGADNWINNVDIVFNGTRPASAMMKGVEIGTPITIEATTYSKLIVAEAHQFYAESYAPNDYSTTGITRTFSSDYAGFLNVIETAKGLWQTLKFIDENSFSQYDIDQDLDVFTYYATEPYTTTITRYLEALDSSWDYLNFTCTAAYAKISFDKDLVDDFFAEAKAKSNYDDVATSYSTDTQKVVTLLDDVFDDQILDIIYAPTNTTGYAAGWTVADEIYAVLGNNLTDSSIDGCTEIASIRDATVGFMGNVVVDKAIIENSVKVAGMPSQSFGRFIGLDVTETTYIIKFDIFSDLVAGSTVKAMFDSIFTSIFPHVEAGGVVILAWWGNLIVGAIFGLLAGIIGYAATKKKKDKLKNAMWSGVITFLAISGLMFLFYGGLF